MSANQAWNPYGGQYGYNNGYGGYIPVVPNVAQGTPQMTPQYVPQPQPVPVQQGLPTFNRVVWSQGFEAAKSVPLSPGETVMILDSEGDKFYIASAGQDGRPKPLQSFRYEKDEATGTTADFVTRKEFDELKAAIASMKTPQATEETDGE
jgi:hypothetical protein